jgi:hypothetical protein
MLAILVVISSLSAAQSLHSIELFASNNTDSINLDKAYQRLTGKPQVELKQIIISSLKKNHIEYTRLENIIGVYNLTAENSKILYIPDKKDFSNKQIFTLARQLAIKLKQNSIAVFIPEKDAAVGSVTITVNNKHSIQENIKLIYDKLPKHYSSALSLHIDKGECGIKCSKVTMVEWLGSNINIVAIKKVFPEATIRTLKGRSYLIYKNGKVKLL